MSYEELITPKEARAILKVSNKTLWSWYRRGLIRAVRLPSGRLRYYKADIERILRGEAVEGVEGGGL
jgi:predicted site-specific integrase-resolvase